jgi:exopolysaccharide/PEP-CTERM locus tyrosine autokinase
LSFIDKALERAKESRQKEELAGEKKTGPTPEVQKPLPVMGNLGGVGTPHEICYTVTRSMPVDFDYLKENHIVIAENYPLVAEEYKLLRTQILHKTKKDNLNTIMFAGPKPNEGKSVTTINVAISIAQEIDQTVLVVDADLRNPSIHKYFGLSGKKGLVDFLKGGVPIPELLIHPEGIGKLVILPGGKPVSDAAELIKSPQMVDLVHELKYCYQDRYVLFDLPPILKFADTLAFAPIVDGIVLVVEAGRTTREDLAQCLEMLKDFNVMGVVLNKVNKIEVKDFYSDYYQTDFSKKPKKKFFGI